MTETGEKQTVKPWRWPAEWMRDQGFWRDVASRTLSAVFAAFLVYLFALAAGYVSRPNVSRSVLALSLTSAIFGAVTWLARRSEQRDPSPAREPLTQERWQAMPLRRRALIVIQVLIYVMGVLASVVSIFYMIGMFVFGWSFPY